MSEVWYYADPLSKSQKGPLSLEQLQRILASLPDAKDALVWRGDFPEWKGAGEIVELRVQTITPPPLPNTFSDAQMPTWKIRWWWVLAFLCMGSVGSRDGRRMMAWVTGQRRNARRLRNIAH